MKKEDYKMKTGKYEGCKLEDIPLSYIAYVYEEWDLCDKTRSIFRKEILQRADAFCLLVDLRSKFSNNEIFHENLNEVDIIINQIAEQIYE